MKMLVIVGRYIYRVATAPVATMGGLPVALEFEGGHRITVAPEVVVPEGGFTAPLLGAVASRLPWGPAEVGLRLSGGVPVEIVPAPADPTPGVLVVYTGEGPYLKGRVTGPTPGRVGGAREIFTRPNRGRFATPNGVWLLPPPPPEGLALDFRWKWEEVGLRLFPEGVIVGPRAEVERALAVTGQEEVL